MKGRGGTPTYTSVTMVASAVWLCVCVVLVECVAWVPGGCVRRGVVVCSVSPKSVSDKASASTSKKKTIGALRLRALSGEDDEGRRAPFFGRKSYLSAEARGMLEGATTATLRYCALGDDSDFKATCGVLAKSREELVRAYGLALADIANGRAPQKKLRSPYAEALSRLRAEVETAAEDVDFCLSLADRVHKDDEAKDSLKKDQPNTKKEEGFNEEFLKLDEDEDANTDEASSLKEEEEKGLLGHKKKMTTTRLANELSNRLLRAACYGDEQDVALARADMEEILLKSSEFFTSSEPLAYVEALATLATSEERASVAESAFATFFLERKAETPLALRLGDAYSVALQRFLGELTRRGAIEGAGFSKVQSSSEPELVSLEGAGLLGRGRLRFNFIEWEMRLRRELVTSRAKDSERALHPTDFVGTWQIVFLFDDIAKDDLLSLVDVITDDDDGTAVEVLFLPDGKVTVVDKNNKNTKESQWRVRPGPAHLDTCEFDIFLENKNVAFCGYIDRGQRIESRFSKRPIKVSGFAYEDNNNDAEDRAPSGRFAMLGPVGVSDRSIAPF